VALLPEPTNKADSRAIAVQSCRGVRIGYVTAERCGRIGQLIRAGRPVIAVFQRPADFGAIIRLSFDGNHPELPDALVAAKPPKFWPD